MESPRQRAKLLRQHTTLPERLLWSQLRGRRLDGHRFRRQHPIGPYVADFACIERRLVIEIDGKTHEFQDEYDARRTTTLESMGFTVLRFSNAEVLRDAAIVAEAIKHHLNS